MYVAYFSYDTWYPHYFLTECEFNGNCYGIGDELIDKKRCKHVYCKADDALGAVVQLRKYGRTSFVVSV